MEELCFRVLWGFVNPTIEERGKQQARRQTGFGITREHRRGGKEMRLACTCEVHYAKEQEHRHEQTGMA